LEITQICFVVGLVELTLLWRVANSGE